MTLQGEVEELDRSSPVYEPARSLYFDRFPESALTFSLLVEFPRLLAISGNFLQERRGFSPFSHEARLLQIIP